MADRMLMLRKGDMLIPADNQSLDELRKLPVNHPLGVDTVQVRNIQMHRKCFAMLQLAFSYWQPANFVTSVEKHTVAKLGKFLVGHGMDRETVRNLCKQFLQSLNRGRETLDAEKSFEAFREFVTVEAGFYDTVLTPAGPKKIAKSWAFKNMSQERFEALYKAVFNVVWDLILKQTFESPDQAEQAAMNLLEFD